MSTTSKAPRRLLVCATTTSDANAADARSWLDARLQEESLTYGDAHRELARRFNEIRRTGRLTQAVA